MIPENFHTQPLLSGEQPSFDELARFSLALPDRPAVQLPVYYAPAGHSPALGTVMLVPGFLQPAYCWRKQIGPLTETWNVLTWDPSWSLQGGWTESLRHWTAELAAVLAASPFSAHLPVVLVGWSLGGMLVQEFLRREAALRWNVAGLVLVGTSLPPTSSGEPFAEDHFPLQLSEPLTARWLVQFTTLLSAQPLPPAEFERHLGGSCLALTRLLQSFGEQTSLGSLLVQLAPDSPESEPGLPLHQLPTLIIHGEQDQLLPPMHAQRLAAWLERLGVPVTLSLYSTSGHAPFLEEPERFNRELTLFLQQHCCPSPRSAPTQLPA